MAAQSAVVRLPGGSTWAMSTGEQRPTTTRPKGRQSMTDRTPRRPEEENDENIRLDWELEDDTL